MNSDRDEYNAYRLQLNEWRELRPKPSEAALRYGNRAFLVGMLFSLGVFFFGLSVFFYALYLITS